MIKQELIFKSKYLNQVDRYAKQMINKHKDIYVFFRVIATNPRTTGAIIPSSKWLAKEMASHVVHDDGVVIELGAGTGVITEALLQSGIKPEKIIIVEYSPEFVQQLRHRFPTIRIIEGDAANLIMLLEGNVSKINTIISSLPLRSLSKLTTQSILEQIKLILPEKSRYIQFTYSFKQNAYKSLVHFKPICSKRIWLNLPPAQVDVWERIIRQPLV